VLLASAEVKLSQWQDARTVFERILAIDKNDEDSLLGLGDCRVGTQAICGGDRYVAARFASEPSPVAGPLLFVARLCRIGQDGGGAARGELHQRMEQMSFAQPELGSEGNNSTW